MILKKSSSPSVSKMEDTVCRAMVSLRPFMLPLTSTKMTTSFGEVAAWMYHLRLRQSNAMTPCSSGFHLIPLGSPESEECKSWRPHTRLNMEENVTLRIWTIHQMGQNTKNKVWCVVVKTVHSHDSMPKRSSGWEAKRGFLIMPERRNDLKGKTSLI